MVRVKGRMGVAERTLTTLVSKRGSWLRDLAALGHIELAWGDNATWCAAPPLLTMLPEAVAGTRYRRRTRWLFDSGRGEGPSTGSLVSSAEALDLWLDECPAVDGPSTLLVACMREGDARHRP